MKKIYNFLMVGFLLFSFPVFGQVHIGSFTGLNLGFLSGDPPEQGYYGSLFGLNAGLQLDIPLKKNLSISVQPSYSQEGTTVNFDVMGKVVPVDSVHIRLDYFSFPLLIKLQSTNKHFYAIGGLEAAWLISNVVYSHGKTLDNLDINNINLSVQIGTGYRFFIGLPKLYMEIRYGQGLVNVSKPNGNKYIPRVKTAGFKFLMGLEIPIRKK